MDGGWLPEPWSSRLVLDAGASVLLDEATLWPNGKFPTTVLMVRTEFLQQYPDTVRALLRGHLKAIDVAAADPAQAKTVVNEGLQKLTGNALAGPVIDRAFPNITLDPDPLAATFPQLAQDSATAGITDKPTDLAGFVDVGPLNAELQAAGKPTVDAAGLDKPRRRPDDLDPRTHRASRTGRAAVDLGGVGKVFGRGPDAVTALAGVDLRVQPGEFVVLLGASGCGKTTLLNLVAGLDQPSSGTVAGRQRRPAVMFQEPALLPWLDAGRNVELPLRLAGSAAGAPGPRRRAAGPGAAGRAGAQAAARAVRRDAPAGRAGPRARRDRRRRGRGRAAADGRAVRRAGRDHPRLPAGRAAADLGGHRHRGAVRDPRRARGRPARAAGGAAVLAARHGRARVARGDGRPEQLTTRSPGGCGR